ncbi:hypothetical protein B7Z28_00410 [Candidatus Saccharibacteria bacterium 32-45-3]|nr:MAG: hypothetical protein B7Z28_00410 [Candidatus Saccharibacteria bacterium 32-45-3]
MMIDPSGEIQQQAALDKQNAEIQKMIEEEALTNRPLDGYEVTKFDASQVSELKVETLKQGEGEVLDASSTIFANYFGWTSDGKIFDSTNKDGTVTPAEFPLSQVIPGWTEGLTGVKVGSVVKLTIPADKAYGTAGSPPNIGPDEPLQFIVEVISKK